MKKHILLLLLTVALLGSTRSTAQPYQSIFGRDSTVWNVSVVEWWLPPDTLGMRFHSKYCRIEGDTLISGQTYKILNTVWHSKLGFSVHQKYLMREDTNQGKVWIRDIDSNLDYLLMDLSMNVGDSIALWLFSGYWAKVQSIHYDAQGRKVLTLDGIARYLTYANFPHVEYVQFIEGVGNTAGFDTPLWRHIDAWMLCQSKDGTMNYSNPYLINCDTGVLATTSEVKDKRLPSENPAISPNPVINRAKITGVQKERIQEYALYNCMGHLQLRVKASDKIDMANLAPGVYYLKIIMRNGQTFFCKLIKL